MPLHQTLVDLCASILAVLKFIARLIVVVLILIAAGCGAFLLSATIFRITEYLWHHFLANPW